MFYRLRRFVETKKQFWLREVYGTPPLASDPNGPVFVSQLAAIYVDMFILAAKSIGVWIKPSQCVILSDGTLKRRHINVLRRHLPNVRVLTVSDIEVHSCPRGGCWERLLLCLRESEQRFVLQLDSDTVTVERPDAVIACIAANQSFTMSGCMSDDPTDPSTRKMTVQEAAAARIAELSASPHPHIQIVAETTLPILETTIGSYYIRGSAGFAGFAKGGSSTERVVAFSSAMEARIGQRWLEWGTEQVASNFIVANSPGGSVLPWPAFAGQRVGLPDNVTTIHFTGDDRFRHGTYKRASRKAVSLMR